MSHLISECRPRIELLMSGEAGDGSPRMTADPCTSTGTGTGTVRVRVQYSYTVLYSSTRTCTGTSTAVPHVRTGTSSIDS